MSRSSTALAGRRMALRYAPLPQRLVEGGVRRGCIGADNNGRPPIPDRVNDGEEHLIPGVRSHFDAAFS